MQKWTNERIDSALKILGKHDRFSSRLYDELSVRLGFDVTQKALWNALERNGKGAPGRWLADTDRRRVGRSADVVSPLPDPVQQYEERAEASKQKRQIDSLVEQLREARARQSFIDSVGSHSTPPKILRRERSSGMREMTAVVLASDWHVEETIDPVAVAHRNEYSLAIAERRIERFFQSIIWNVEHHRASGRIAIRDMVLWLGGDLITGYIHEELQEANALSPVQTVLWLMPKLRDGIVSVLNHLQLEHLEIVCSHGNHGRTTPKRRIATGAQNSFEHLAYNMLAGELRGESRIHFEITTSAHQYAQVYDSTLHFHHGDEVGYGGGIGGLSIPLNKRIASWDRLKPAHVHNVGHFHQLLDLGRAVVNGSLIGYGSFSMSIGASFEAPQQCSYYIDSARGKCLTTALWVDEDPKSVVAA